MSVAAMIGAPRSPRFLFSTFDTAKGALAVVLSVMHQQVLEDLGIKVMQFASSNWVYSGSFMRSDGGVDPNIGIAAGGHPHILFSPRVPRQPRGYRREYATICWVSSRTEAEISGPATAVREEYA